MSTDRNFPEEYWTKRWQKGETGWDIGFPSTPLASYIEQLKNKELTVLIPGAGNAWEAELMHNLGFTNVYVIDISQSAIDQFKNRVPSFNSSHLICGDFFKLEKQFDLIIEQTFFCALSPTLRADYCKKMSELLKPTGKLVGLLFQIPLFTEHPPFGGDKNEYQELFSPHFNIEIMETANNSIEPRKGNELFIKMTPN